MLQLWISAASRGPLGDLIICPPQPAHSLRIRRAGSIGLSSHESSSAVNIVLAWVTTVNSHLLLHTDFCVGWVQLHWAQLSSSNRACSRAPFNPKPHGAAVAGVGAAQVMPVQIPYVQPLK